MKKILCLVVSFVLISCVMPVNAEQSKPTHWVSVMEFYKLCAKRIATYNTTIDGRLYPIDDSASTPIVVQMPSPGSGYLVTGYGILMLNEELSIYHAVIPFMEFDADETRATELFTSAAISVSALEMDDMQENSLKLLHDKIDSEKPESAFENYMNILNDLLSDVSESDIENWVSGDEIPFWQGNYDYYIQYMDIEEVGGTFEIVAKARN